MANFYFEIPEEATFFGVAGPHVALHNQDANEFMLRGRLGIIQHSYRVWKETNDGVFFVKNRVTGSLLPNPLTDDELKEFMWVKLRAKII